MVDLSFYKGKKVLITGHTGFKGTWMCQVLVDLGASVIGYALEPPTNPSLFQLTKMEEKVQSVIGDIRDYEKLLQLFQEVQPEIVIHMAAQPIVRESYQNPVYTYEVNVMGTVNILECVRKIKSVKSFLNVTTDKVYLNKEKAIAYKESDELNGWDPYSNSKSCSELVTSSYINSFFTDKRVAISTARAGNVIGGGDFAADRIIPDCVRAIVEGKEIAIRNPNSIRPYQHVLEPIMAYLLIVEKQYQNPQLAGNYNVGPREDDCWTTGSIVRTFCDKWNAKAIKELKYIIANEEGPHEANYLSLDCSKIAKILEWEPKWNVAQSLDNIVEWYETYFENENINFVMQKQIIKCFGDSSN